VTQMETDHYVKRSTK